jgi:phosphoesterase RecJ-like protein
MLIGTMSDTGGMRFPNTTADTFRLADWLMQQGADHDDVTRALFFCDTLGYVRLTGHVINNLKMAFDGRLAYFILERDTLDSFGVPNADSEDLIDTIRGIRGVDVACRMQEVDGAIRFSLRSMNRDLPIIGIAHAIGGGGHAMAAGATGTGMTLAEAEQTLLRLVEELFRGSTGTN